MLTAGLGTRLRPLTEKTPKPCLNFHGHRLMDYGFYLAQQAGFKDFIFNLHYLAEQVRQHTQSLSPLCKSVQYSDETEKILGSGGAIWKAKDKLIGHDSFLIANGDEILIPNNPYVLKELMDKFNHSKSLCCLLTCDHPDLLKTLKPVWVNKSGEVQGFGMNKPNLEVHPVHYTGYKVFSTRIFDFLPNGESNIFYDVLVDAIKQGEKVSTYHLDSCHWYETGNPTEYNLALNACEKKHGDYLHQVDQFYKEHL